MAADVDNALDWEALDCTDLLDPDLRDPADPPPPPPPPPHEAPHLKG